MTKLSIVGTGTMAHAIAGLVGKGGHTVQLIGQHDQTQASGDIVVLAVPHGALSAIVAERGAELAGKIVVDITNPVDFGTLDSLAVPADSSAAAQLAEALPQSRVVKAFNTTFGGTLVAGTVGDNVTTVLVASDDADAKSTLADVFAASGIKVVDAGSLRRARELEALGFLQISLAANEKISWTGGFALIA